jgi:hypothetical protein
MAVTLNQRAYEHAKELTEGKFVFDERDVWSEYQPSAQEENEFIRLHGFAEYGKWYLGINDEKPEDTKGHYEFPYGDFNDIANATWHLHGMMEGRKAASAPKRSRAASPGKTAREARHPT